MNINATIIGQFITFAILIWFTFKYVWPPITKTLTVREKKIADGLEAAERSKRELEMAEHKIMAMLKDAKQQASQIIEQSNVHAAKIIEEAKAQAKIEGQRLVDLAQGEITRSVLEAKEQIKSQLASLAVAGAEKIIKQKLDPSLHHELLDNLVAEI